MRISDWSSDVCSSDLACVLDKLGENIAERVIEEAGDSGDGGRIDLAVDRGGKGHLGLLDKWKFSACSPPPLFPDRRRARSKPRSEEHTSELQSLMRISYSGFCLTQKKTTQHPTKSIVTLSQEPH